MAKHSNTNSVTETVLSFIDALNHEDLKTARNYVTDDMKFVGLLV